ncbi:MAG: aminoglycoside phosphotransferase family protein [Acidimicrobiales bacterium]
MGDLRIPAKLASTSVAWEGDEAEAWLARLPRLVRELAEVWELDVGAPLEPGGQISWVAPARRRGDIADVILKVQLPHPESEPEAVGLRAWAGAGAVSLLADDPERHALLIERCRPGHGLLDEGGTNEAVEAGAAVGALLHDAPIPGGLGTLTARLSRWADDLDRTIDLSVVPDPGLVARALHTMRTRPSACDHDVLLHGDLNPTNVLAAERAPWLAIDPKPMVGDPAYDGARLVLQPDPLRNPDPAAVVRDRVAIVSSAMEIDADALLEWCLVDAIEIGAFARDRGDPATAHGCDEQAALVARLLP